MNQKKGLHRREFVVKTTRMLATLSLLGLAETACRQGSTWVGDVELKGGRMYVDLNKPSFRLLHQVGKGVSLRIGAEQPPILLIRYDEKTMIALSGRCTHAGYAVLPPEHGILVCSSGHGGRFSLEGKVLSPPPTHDLHRFPVSFSGETVIVDYAG